MGVLKKNRLKSVYVNVLKKTWVKRLVLIVLTAMGYKLNIISAIITLVIIYILTTTDNNNQKEIINKKIDNFFIKQS